MLLTGVPTVTGAERVLEIIEQSGGRLVAMENCTGLKPILEDVDAAASDPLRALAEKYFHLPCSVMTPNHRRLETLRRLIADYRPDCVIELIWQACLTYDVESHRVRRLAEEEAGLPYLRIETDYSPSDSARIAVRVEALFETVRGRRPAPSAWWLMNAVAYCHPFVPPEWIAAHGLRPCWLPCRAGDEPAVWVRRGVVRWPPRGWTISRGELPAEAVVLTTTCDQIRYAAALLQHLGRLPVFLLHVPQDLANRGGAGVLSRRSSAAWAGSSSAAAGPRPQATPFPRRCSATIGRGHRSACGAERCRRVLMPRRSPPSAAIWQWEDTEQTHPGRCGQVGGAG